MRIVILSEHREPKDPSSPTRIVVLSEQRESKDPSSPTGLVILSEHRERTIPIRGTLDFSPSKEKV
jgi:hypothetical protein